jgi:hypothetical protein
MSPSALFQGRYGLVLARAKERKHVILLTFIVVFESRVERVIAFAAQLVAVHLTQTLRRGDPDSHLGFAAIPSAGCGFAPCHTKSVLTRYL